MVVTYTRAAGATGIGWTFAHRSAADLASGPLANAVRGCDVMATSSAWTAMTRAVRNFGRPGLAWEAISSVDIALWDLKAKLLGLCLASLLGRAREDVPLYGSGGFTSYDERELEEQLGGWANDGFRAVKMKVGRHPAEDLRRVRVARKAVGPEVELFVAKAGARRRGVVCAGRGHVARRARFAGRSRRAAAAPEQSSLRDGRRCNV